MVFRIVVEQFGRYDGLDHVLHNVCTDLLDLKVRRLRRYHDSFNAKRPPVAILDRYLRFTVRTQIGNRAVTTNLRQLPRQIVRHLYRHRHELGRFVTGVAKHETLVPGSATVNTLRNVRRLRPDRVDNAAGV